MFVKIENNEIIQVNKLPEEAIIPNYKHVYTVVENVEETYTETITRTEKQLVSEAVVEEREITDEEGNVVGAELVEVTPAVYEDVEIQEEVERVRLVPTEVQKEVEFEAKIINPTAEQLGYEEITVEAREGFIWHLEIIDNKIEVVYDEIVEYVPTEEELAEIARQEAEAERIAEEQAEAKRLAEIAGREARFNNEFFQTSLGYIRKQVNMVNGTKSFLYDLLPTITLGVNAGQEVKVIAYNRPESFEEEIDYTELQHEEVVNMQFIMECMNQVSREFKGE